MHGTLNMKKIVWLLQQACNTYIRAFSIGPKAEYKQEFELNIKFLLSGFMFT